MKIIKPNKNSVEVYDAVTRNRNYTLPISEADRKGLVIQGNNLVAMSETHAVIYDLQTGQRKGTI